MSKYGIGQPVLRFEDPRLLRGQGRFINDVNLHGQLYAVEGQAGSLPITRPSVSVRNRPLLASNITSVLPN